MISLAGFIALGGVIALGSAFLDNASLCVASCGVISCAAYRPKISASYTRARLTRLFMLQMAQPHNSAASS